MMCDPELLPSRIPKRPPAPPAELENGLVSGFLSARRRWASQVRVRRGARSDGAGVAFLRSG
eukprot:scaffold40_cov305-Pinguiococcus_pyrenoidosus.AAC.32